MLVTIANIAPTPAAVGRAYSVAVSQCIRAHTNAFVLQGN